MPAGSVFVGNIPYDATEATLGELFAEAGPVRELRLVADRDSGKLRGYGFVEYDDYATAMSAVRNLNGREYNGRALRVDHAETMAMGGGKQPTPGGTGGADAGTGAGERDDASGCAGRGGTRQVCADDGDGARV